MDQFRHAGRQLWAEAVSKLPLVLDFGAASAMRMAGFIEAVDRGQTVLFRDWLEGWIGKNSLVRVVDLLVAEVYLTELGLGPAAPARPGDNPAVLLKIFICGYLNHIPLSRRVERTVFQKAVVRAGRLENDKWRLGSTQPA